MSSYEPPKESNGHRPLTARELNASMAQFEKLCEEASDAAESLQLGKAERLVEQAISLADATPWVTREQKESRLVVRDLAIGILSQSRCYQQALENADQQMVIYGSLYGGYSLEICLTKCSLLLALERYEEAEGIIAGVIERARENGDVGDVVVGHVHRAQCLALQGEHARADHEILCACNFLTQLNSSETLLVAQSFRDYASFERERGDIGKAIAAVELARQCLTKNESIAEVISVLLDDIDLFQAEAYAVNGDQDKASDLRFQALTRVTNSRGRMDSMAFQLRDILGDAAFYRGDLDEAENYFQLNLNLAKQSENERFIRTAAASFANFCNQTGRINQLGDDLNLLMDVSNGAEEDLFQFRTRIIVMANDGEEGLDRAVQQVKSELEKLSDISQISTAAVRCELLLLLAELEVKCDGKEAQTYLEEAEGLAMAFPTDVSEALFERINDLRKASSVEEEGLGGQIERIKAFIEDHRESYGDSRPFMEAKLRLPLGLVYIHEGKYEDAESEFELARELLENNHSTDSKLYGQVLMGLAAALERQFHNADGLRAKAELILRKYDRDTDSSE